jgi:hypothetical protein
LGQGRVDGGAILGEIATAVNRLRDRLRSAVSWGHGRRVGVRQCGAGRKRMFASNDKGPNSCGVEQIIVELHEIAVTD